MVPRARLAALDVSTPFEDVLRFVATSPYSRIPMYRGSLDRVVGILHIKDLVTDFVAGHRHASVVSLLRPIVRAAETTPADRLLAFLREYRSHQALVVDAAGSVVGLITLEDVVAELLGGIADEFKGPTLRALVLTDGRVRLPGGMRLEQAAQLLGAAWQGHAATVGAFVKAVLGRVPGSGERVSIEGVDVEVESIEGDAVASVIVGPRRTLEERP
jgi:CBS domain containing-hemolysin-like protein